MGAGRVAAIDGEHFDELMAELDASVHDVLAAVDREPALWFRSLPGKWTCGQHVTHLTITLSATASALQKNAREMQFGNLPPPPRRGLLEFLWVFLAIRRGKLPRGGKTPRRFEPPDLTDSKYRAITPEHGLAGLRNRVDDHRLIGARFSPEQRDRLWILNPFHHRWHYSFPEVLRMHAVHVRHHTKSIEEITHGS